MYMEPWMIATIILSYAICAFFSFRRGAKHGITVTVGVLEKERVITVNRETGEIAPRGTIWNNKPKRRSTRANKTVDKH